MFPYYFLRISGPILIFLLGIKIISGYALSGKIDSDILSGLHREEVIDKILIPLFLFHSFYGLRLFLIELGIDKERFLFWLFTIISLITYGLIYYFLL
jgi:succinate dehydrogenase/fumarate reductase cytochrome b subunit